MSDEKKKKPSLALVVSMGAKGKAPAGEDDGDEPESDGEGYEVARDELAELLGVPDDKREAFGEGLRAFIETC